MVRCCTAGLGHLGFKGAMELEVCTGPGPPEGTGPVRPAGRTRAAQRNFSRARAGLADISRRTGRPL